MAASVTGPAAAPAEAAPANIAVWAWGDNSFGQATVPAALTDVTTVAAGMYHNLALTRDGTVVAWGDNSGGESTVPPGLTGVTAVAAGGIHSLALKSDGTVVAWGDNELGQTTLPPGLTGVTSIAAGTYHSLALKSDGTVVAWGFGVKQTSVPPGLTGVVAVAAGGFHSLALKSDGTVVAWGSNNDGESTVPLGLTDVVAVAAGHYFSLALKSDGTVVAWGWNFAGQTSVPPGLTGVTAIDAGASHSLALKNDGTVVAWGSNEYGQADVPTGLTGVTAVSGGALHSLALRVTLPSDVLAPTVTIGLPAPGASYVLGQLVAADFGAADEPGGSGLSSLTGMVDGGTLVADGGLLPTGSPGTHTLVVTATDQAGNTGSASAQYVVFAAFGTAGGRVQAPPIVNAAVKAGATVPIQFSLGVDLGLSIFEPGYPMARQVPCDTFSGDPADGDTPGDITALSGLSFDPAAGQYNYRWKTNKVWAGQCWQLQMKFSSTAGAYAGASVWFNFRFDK